MTIKEKIAYLKGLAEGLDLGKNSREDKLFTAVIDTLCLMADEIDELNELTAEISEGMDAISEDLSDVEDFLLEDDYDEDDDDYDDYDFYEDEFDEECGCPFCNGEDFSYIVECPECGTELELDERDLAEESIECPECGELLEYDFIDDDEDDPQDDNSDSGDSGNTVDF